MYSWREEEEGVELEDFRTAISHWRCARQGVVGRGELLYLSEWRDNQEQRRTEEGQGWKEQAQAEFGKLSEEHVSWRFGESVSRE